MKKPVRLNEENYDYYMSRYKALTLREKIWNAVLTIKAIFEIFKDDDFRGKV